MTSFTHLSYYSMLNSTILTLPYLPGTSVVGLLEKNSPDLTS